MNTFLPYADFALSARCLDNKRLGKQRIEAYQILQVLLFQKKGWRHHPAVLMWKGYETSLRFYGLAMCAEWTSRGFKDSMTLRFTKLRAACIRKCGPVAMTPHWLNARFCLAHRSNLIRKDRNHYGKLWPGVRDDLPYIWPVRKIDNAV